MSPCSSLIVYVGGFLVGIATNSKTSRVKCGLQPLQKSKSDSEIRTLSPVLNLGFLYSRKGLL